MSVHWERFNFHDEIVTPVQMYNEMMRITTFSNTRFETVIRELYTALDEHHHEWQKQLLLCTIFGTVLRIAKTLGNSTRPFAEKMVEHWNLFCDALDRADSPNCIIEQLINC